MIARWGLFNIRRNRVHPQQAAIINSDTQKRNNADYEQKVGKLSEQQHYIGEFDKYAHGAYFHSDITYDLIYTYDKNTDTVTIHGGNISITPRQPEKLGGGFWDALFFVKPGTQITAPNEYFNPNAPGATGDADGINGNVIWDRTGNGNGNVFAGVIINNKTLESVVKYNQIPTYTISRDADGTFHVFDVWGRLNNIDNENLMHGSYYHYPEGLSISIPQRPTSSVSYHYDVF